jgi:hypothetical protein
LENGLTKTQFLFLQLHQWLHWGIVEQRLLQKLYSLPYLPTSWEGELICFVVGSKVKVVNYSAGSNKLKALNKEILYKSATPMKLNSINNGRLQKSTILFIMFA